MTTNFLIMGSEEFDAWLLEKQVKRKITLIQNHHTLRPRYADFNGGNHLALLQAMERYHVNVRHFVAIGQNFTTFPDGKIAVCRDLERAPACIKRVNSTGVCLENLGDFDPGCDVMTPEHRQIILAANAALCRKLHLTPGPAAVVYHAWFNLASGARDNENGQKAGDGEHKTCPGAAFFGGNKLADAEARFYPEIAKLTAGDAVLLPASA